MHIPVVGFVPPVEGVEAEFNTFRLGLKLSRTIPEGSEVLLMDEKNKVAFGRAQVTQIVTGKLGELCLIHAANNHRELQHDDKSDAPRRLFEYLQKLFGPHIVTVNKQATVLYMKRLE